MTVRLKLLVALSAAVLAISHANAAPAERSERERALRPKDSFKECDACPKMVVIPKGSFIMGTPADEYSRLKGEDPQHRVTFARPIAVGRFTISFDEWDACVADGGCGGNKGNDRGFGRGRLPVYGINFAAAKSYLAWLSRKAGRTCRLPSESEREYFTRAGTTTPFWFGKTISAQNANYDATNVIPADPMARAARDRSTSTLTSRTNSGCIRSAATPRNGPRIATTSATTRIHPPTAAVAGGRLLAPHAARRRLDWPSQHPALGLSQRQQGRQPRQLSRGQDAERAAVANHGDRSRLALQAQPAAACPRMAGTRFRSAFRSESDLPCDGEARSLGPTKQ